MNLSEEVTSLANEGLLFADQLLLLKQVLYLLKREETSPDNKAIADYGFLVFTAAKVYEGFLKNFFFQLGLISNNQYRDEHFRIGKALNPDLPFKYRNSTWLYDELMAVCGAETAAVLWETWRSGRNEIFHYFPDNGNVITLTQAKAIIEKILGAMHQASHCEIRVKREAGD